MITITDKAKQHLKDILSANVDTPQAGIRLTDRGNGEFGLGIDVENSDDKVVELDGSKVLMVESKLADQLTGTTMDIEDTKEGPVLVMLENQS
jgi:Fe-S cluster assembly iron-binding protein IscA